jgi:hypothetical protein
MNESDSLIWKLQNPNRHRIECIVRFALGGVQVEIISDRSPLISRVFANGAEAVAWAEGEREASRQGGV